MPLYEWSEVEPKTLENVDYQINEFSDEINRKGLVTWMKFQKVARSKDNPSDEDGEYGGDNGVKFQTKWLTVELSPLQLFSHLCATIYAYLPHAYEVKL